MGVCILLIKKTEVAKAWGQKVRGICAAERREFLALRTFIWEKWLDFGLEAVFNKSFEGYEDGFDLGFGC